MGEATSRIREVLHKGEDGQEREEEEVVVDGHPDSIVWNARNSCLLCIDVVATEEVDSVDATGKEIN